MTELENYLCDYLRKLRRPHVAQIWTAYHTVCSAGLAQDASFWEEHKGEGKDRGDIVLASMSHLGAGPVALSLFDTRAVRGVLACESRETLCTIRSINDVKEIVKEGSAELRRLGFMNETDTFHRNLTKNGLLSIRVTGFGRVSYLWKQGGPYSICPELRAAVGMRATWRPCLCVIA